MIPHPVASADGFPLPDEGTASTSPDEDLRYGSDRISASSIAELLLTMKSASTASAEEAGVLPVKKEICTSKQPSALPVPLDTAWVHLGKDLGAWAPQAPRADDLLKQCGVQAEEG